MIEIFVAIFAHRHGVDVATFSTEDLANTWKDELAKDYWDELNEELAEGDEDFVAMPETGIGNLYFEIKGASTTPEYFEVHKTILRSE